MIKIKAPKTTKLGWFYLFIMIFVSFSVADYGSDVTDPLEKLLWIILWFTTLMAGYTGWVKETEKYEKRQDDKDAA